MLDIKPGSLADRIGAARDFAGNLNGVVEWVAALRTAEWDECPDPAPVWWNTFEKDQSWRYRAGEPAPDQPRHRPGDSDSIDPRERHKYARFKAYDAMNFCLEKWDGHATAIPPLGDENWRPGACKSGIRAMRALIQPATMTQWRYGSVPDPRHLDEPLPEAWSPEPVGEAESKAENQRDHHAYRLAVGPCSDPAQERKQLANAERRRRSRMNKRLSLDVQAQKGRVTHEELRHLQALRDAWHEEIERWQRHEQAVSDLVAFLCGRVVEETENTQRAESTAKRRVVKPDPDEEYLPAAWFKEKFGIDPDRLDKAARDGRLDRRRVGRFWHYPLSGVRALWPEEFTTAA